MAGIIILVIFSLIFMGVGMGLIVSGSQSMKVFIKKTIIGAGAVVISDIPDECVAVGNPCRIIKSN